MAQTEKGIIYPYDYNEVADVPADLKALAESIDRILSDYSLNTDSGNKIVLEMNNTTYKIKAILKDKDNNVINTSNEIDLPLESMVTNISYNNQILTLTHQDGQTTEVSIADLISDLASKEEVEELQSQVDDLTTLVETELESNEVEGTEIDVSDSAEYRGRMEVKGNTEQEQLSGKNLFDKDNPIEKRGSINDNNIFRGGGGNYCIVIPCKPNTTYTAQKRNDGDTNRLALASCETNPSDTADVATPLLNNVRNDSAGNLSITTGSTANYIIMQYYRNVESTLTKQQMLDSIQIEEGSTATDYEPYCGGQASPNPDYPQEIKVVTGDNVVHHVGKNLLDTSKMLQFTPSLSAWCSLDGIEKFYSATNIVKSNLYYDLKPNIQYSFSVYKFNNISQSASYPFQLVKSDGNVIATTNLSNLKVTFTVNEATRAYPRIMINESNILTQCIVQLEEGSTVTPYEPYRGEDYNLNLGNIELCKIGDYEDIPFKNVVGDENYNAELEDGAWYKKKVIDKKVLDDLWEWFMPSTNRFHVNITLPDGEYDLVALCDKFINALYWTTHINTDKSFIVHNGNWGNNLCRISFVDKNCASLAEWTQFVSENNLIVYHRLLNPTYEKITNTTLISQLEALRKAKWFKGVNHWWTETENLEPNLKGTYKQSNNLRIKEQDERLTNLESRLALLE